MIIVEPQITRITQMSQIIVHSFGKPWNDTYYEEQNNNEKNPGG